MVVPLMTAVPPLTVVLPLSSSGADVNTAVIGTSVPPPSVTGPVPMALALPRIAVPPPLCVKPPL